MPVDPLLLPHLERAITRERLRRYLKATSQDVAAAVALYELNADLASAVLGLLCRLEVGLRNSMHEVLTAQFQTARWYAPGGAPLTAHGQRKVEEAIRYAGGGYPPPGKVVAELSYGFWAGLAGRTYHNSLWVPCLSRAFPAGKLSRLSIHIRLERILQLRNRVAHHEPVSTSRRALHIGVGQSMPLEELLECAGWLSAELEGWLRTSSSYRVAVSILDEIATSGVAL